MDDDNSQMSAEDLEVLEVVANAEMLKASKPYLMSTSPMVIVNLSLNPIKSSRDYPPRWLFSHYYHIWRPNVAEQVLRIHLFFLDATQLDPETGSCLSIVENQTCSLERT